MPKPLLYAYAPVKGDAALSLFPTELGGGVYFSVDEVISQGQAYASFYEKLVSLWTPTLQEHVGTSERSAEVLARVGGVPLFQFWADRLLRMLRLQETSSFAVAKAPPLYPVKSIDEFHPLVSGSADWNQRLLFYFAQILGLEIRDAEFHIPATAIQSTPGFVNHNFDFHRKDLPTRLIRRCQSELSKYLGHTPAMHMVNARSPMLDAGLYNHGLLIDFSPDIIHSGPPPDFRQREEIFRRLAEVLYPYLGNLFRGFGASAELVDIAVRDFGVYLSQTYPTSLLEGAQENLKRWEKCLARYQGRTLISSGVSFTTESAFAIAAARTVGMPVIGSQHGGYQGYTCWQTWALEGEYALCDSFITWGWTRQEQHGASKNVQMIALPSPWLWDRKKLWEPHICELLAPARSAEFDILFMPNKVYAFPPAPTGIQATINDIVPYAKFIREFTTTAFAHKISVLHKPHNQLTLDLFPFTHEEIQNLGGDLYHLNKKLNKGLSLELLKRCHLVVWELPGTGFLECLTSGIPAMVIWNRSYNRETHWAELIFKDLEDSGIVHRSSASLIQEYRKFRADPNAWMQESKRIKTINRFCSEYAWACEDWPEYWRRFLKKIRQ